MAGKFVSAKDQAKLDDMWARLAEEAEGDIRPTLRVAAGKMRNRASHFGGKNNLHSKELSQWADLMEKAANKLSPTPTGDKTDE